MTLLPQTRAGPLSLRPIFQNGPRRPGSAPRAKTRALDRSGPFRKSSSYKEKGASVLAPPTVRFRKSAHHP